jgi:membrane-associated protein
VHKNLESIILCILFVSLLPAFISGGRVFMRRRRESREEAREPEPNQP